MRTVRGCGSGCGRAGVLPEPAPGCSTGTGNDREGWSIIMGWVGSSFSGWGVRWCWALCRRSFLPGPTNRAGVTLPQHRMGLRASRPPGKKEEKPPYIYSPPGLPGACKNRNWKTTLLTPRWDPLPPREQAGHTHAVCSDSTAAPHQNPPSRRKTTPQPDSATPRPPPPHRIPPGLRRPLPRSAACSGPGAPDHPRRLRQRALVGTTPCFPSRPLQ